MKKFIATALVYLMAFFSTAAISNHFIQGDFGSSDLLPLLVWGMPGILLSSFIISQLSKKLIFLRFPLVVIMATALAIVCAIAATAIFPILLGVWFGALSISPFLPNLAGAFSASFITPVVLSGELRKFIHSGLLFLVIVLFFSIGLPFGNSFIKLNVLKGGQILTTSVVLSQQGSQVDLQNVIRGYCPQYHFDQKEWDQNILPQTGGYLLQYPCSTGSLKTLFNFHLALGIPSALKWQG